MQKARSPRHSKVAPQGASQVALRTSSTWSLWPDPPNVLLPKLPKPENYKNKFRALENLKMNSSCPWVSKYIIFSPGKKFNGTPGPTDSPSSPADASSPSMRSSGFSKGSDMAQSEKKTGTNFEILKLQLEIQDSLLIVPLTSNPKVKNFMALKTFR